MAVQAEVRVSVARIMLHSEEMAILGITVAAAKQQREKETLTASKKLGLTVDFTMPSQSWMANVRSSERRF